MPDHHAFTVDMRGHRADEFARLDPYFTYAGPRLSAEAESSARPWLDRVARAYDAGGAALTENDLREGAAFTGTTEFRRLAARFATRAGARATAVRLARAAADAPASAETLIDTARLLRDLDAPGAALDAGNLIACHAGLDDWASAQEVWSAAAGDLLAADRTGFEVLRAGLATRTLRPPGATARRPGADAAWSCPACSVQLEMGRRDLLCASCGTAFRDATRCLLRAQRAGGRRGRNRSTDPAAEMPDLPIGCPDAPGELIVSPPSPPRPHPPAGRRRR